MFVENYDILEIYPETFILESIYEFYMYINHMHN